METFLLSVLLLTAIIWLIYALVTRDKEETIWQTLWILLLGSYLGT